MVFFRNFHGIFGRDPRDFFFGKWCQKWAHRGTNFCGSRSKRLGKGLDGKIGAELRVASLHHPLSGYQKGGWCNEGRLASLGGPVLLVGGYLVAHPLRSPVGSAGRAQVGGGGGTGAGGGKNAQHCVKNFAGSFLEIPKTLF